MKNKKGLIGALVVLVVLFVVYFFFFYKSDAPSGNVGVVNSNNNNEEIPVSNIEIEDIEELLNKPELVVSGLVETEAGFFSPEELVRLKEIADQNSLESAEMDLRSEEGIEGVVKFIYSVFYEIECGSTVDREEFLQHFQRVRETYSISEGQINDLMQVEDAPGQDSPEAAAFFEKTVREKWGIDSGEICVK